MRGGLGDAIGDHARRALLRGSCACEHNQPIGRQALGGEAASCQGRAAAPAVGVRTARSRRAHSSAGSVQACGAPLSAENRFSCSMSSTDENRASDSSVPPANVSSASRDPHQTRQHGVVTGPEQSWQGKAGMPEPPPPRQHTYPPSHPRSRRSRRTWGGGTQPGTATERG